MTIKLWQNQPDSQWQNLHRGDMYEATIPFLQNWLSPAREAIAQTLGVSHPPDYPDSAHPDFFNKIQKARDLIKKDRRIYTGVAHLLEGLNLRPQDFYFDAVRLRAISPGLEHIPDASMAFTWHRDMWYANPHCQINLWIPVFDVAKDASMGILPDYWQKYVPNNSELFDYERWCEQGGFQSLGTHPKLFPSVTEPLDFTSLIRPALPAGQLLAFSPAHLHCTLPNRTSQIRYTLEVRLVHLDDLQNHVTQNVSDDNSTGSTLYDFFHCQKFSRIPHQLITSYLRATR
ncbi:MAG: hypothetical protein KDK38_10785 [Leptospiraceae bacterium]|nr:hypothetical protein [Leptospiraceae bacterium]